VVNEVNQADLAGVGAAEIGAGEHGLTAEDSSQGQAVEPPDEARRVAREPGLDAVGVPGAVEEQERVDDDRGKPGLWAARPGGGAVVDDLLESGIGADVEAAAADAGAEGAGHAESIVQGDDASVQRLDPAGLARAVVVHREPALAVCPQQGGYAGLVGGREFARG
jgi:hypothetical protein